MTICNAEFCSEEADECLETFNLQLELLGIDCCLDDCMKGSSLIHL